MIVLIKEPKKAAYRKNIENTLEELQRTVGGYIETVTLNDKTVMIVDEDGKLKGDQRFNFDLGDDFVCGTAIFAGVNETDFCDIEEDEAERLEEALKIFRF